MIKDDLEESVLIFIIYLLKIFSHSALGFFFYLALKKASAQFLVIDLPLRMRIYSIKSAIR